MKTGLILEGGAMRGLFTAGVTDIFMENGIDFNGLIGVSSGAAFGCNYKSKQPGRTIRYNIKYCKDPRYCSIRSLIKTGDLYGVDFCYHEIPDKLDIFDTKTFAENPMEFYAVCTDVNTGEAIYKKFEASDSNFFEWMRASASMPLAANIVQADGYSLLDGGISDSIPLKYFESIGFNKNVVILTQPEGYVKKKNPLIPIMKITLKDYPKIIDAVAARHIVYNNTLKYINEREQTGEVLVIRPEKALDIGKIEHDPEKMKRVYEYGRKIGKKALGRVEKFLTNL